MADQARRQRKNLSTVWVSQIALFPAWVVVLVFYLFTMAWTVLTSFTSSRIFPGLDFVGLYQYHELFTSTRWNVSMLNMSLYGICFIVGALVIGFLLAAALDRAVRGESIYLSLFLYPFSLSFIVTGVIWQWLLNPTLGLQATVRGWGWEDFTFNWLIRGDRAIYVVAIAAIWHGSGLVMSILLAGIRGVDTDIWRAARVDGVPVWRVYLHVIIPMLVSSIATATVLLATGVVKSYDLILPLTNGGPGIATELPAKFVMDSLIDRTNLGLASAASTVMIITVIAVVAPWVYLQQRRQT